MTTTLLTLVQRLATQLGDPPTFETTTNIPAGSSIIRSTELLSRDGGRDDYFNEWWVYATEGNNIGKERQVSDYASGTSGTLTFRGVAMTAEAGTITCELHRHERTLYVNAINDAIRETTSSLHRRMEDRTLVTGNILPDNSFELWSTSSTPVFYSASNATLARTTTAAYIRGALGTTSLGVTSTAAGGYAYLSSDQYPRLLSLMGKTVTLKAWAYPLDNANDGSVEIYTINAAGSTQTLTSTTANPQAKYSLLELESQLLNDDLTQIQIRFKVTTDASTVYFDSARLSGIDLYEYLVLSDFSDGTISEVHEQVTGNADDICDDLYPESWNEIKGWSLVRDGNYTYLRLPGIYNTNHQLRLIGTVPLETLSADTDTIALDGARINLLIAYAKYKFLQSIEQPIATLDVRRYETASMKAYNEYMRLLPKLRMPVPPISLNLEAL